LTVPQTLAVPRARPIELTSHSSELGRWESAVASPHPSLAPYVSEYFGGSEETFAPLCRRELPADIAPIIINFGAPFRLIDDADPSRWTEIRSFIAGAFDRYVLVGSTGSFACMQINFTILGARLFFGQPMYELANRVVSLDDAFGAEARRLEMALYDAEDWAARFDLLDDAIAARIARAKLPPPAVTHVMRRLVRSHGAIPIGTLASEVGWSHKHLVSQFTEQIGLTPKTLARVLRFGLAADRLASSAGGHLADIAIDCGYYDQSHFTRDFRAFAGVTPTKLLASRLPNRGGFVA
jgi:AraC-like DNA-binding protein